MISLDAERKNVTVFPAKAQAFAFQGFPYELAMKS